MKPKTLVDIARWRAKTQPDERVYTFLTAGGTEERTLTYQQLDREARGIAASLQSVCVPGDRAALLYPSGLEYIAAFWGCLYAGIIPVPAYPPRANRSFERLELLIDDAQPKLCLTTKRLQDRMCSENARYFSCVRKHPIQWFATDTMSTHTIANWKEPDLELDCIALLQYTSGSTRKPRGVMVTHVNLMHNLERISQTFHLDTSSRLVSWLPFYHDMGLIGGVLAPVYTGFPCVLLSSTHFLQRPVRWLQAITHYRATISGGPNFCYDLCIRRIGQEQQKGLDLSRWCVAFNGAEPIHQKTLQEFSAAFESCGFRRTAFQTCYGLAESTLLVTGNRSQSEPLTHVVPYDNRGDALQDSVLSNNVGRLLVSCGKPAKGQELVIVNPRSLIPCLPGQVGEIWISGPSVARGYWNRAEETKETFSAHLPQYPNRYFLRTGDLGFLSQDELFITGRLKDVLIFRGRNHSPEDIEWTVENSHPSLRNGTSAVFSVDHEAYEALVIVSELASCWEKSAQSVLEAIQRAVAEEHELDSHVIVLIRNGSMPRTSSGKIQRHACRLNYSNRTLEIIAEWPLHSSGSIPACQGQEDAVASDVLTNVKRTLMPIWCEVLNSSFTSESDNFFAMNGNSLVACQLVGRVNERFGTQLSQDVLFQAPTFSELAHCIHRSQGCGKSASPMFLISSRSREEFPLSFAQQRMWFQEQLVPGNPFYNIGLRTDVMGPLNLRALEKSLDFLQERHEVLRARFPTLNGKPVQVIAAPRRSVILVVDLSHLSTSRREIDTQRLVDREARRRFDMSEGPLYRVIAIRLKSDAHVVLVVLHHVVCDGWGAGVFISDLTVAYSACIEETQPTLLPLSILYGDFCIWQRDVFAGSPEYDRQAQFWRQLFSDGVPSIDLPTDFPRPPVRGNRGACVSEEFEDELTTELREFARRHNVTVFVVLLCAMTILLHRWTRKKDLVIGTVTALRNRSDIQQLIGCFFNFLPLRVSLEEDLSGLEVLRRVSRVVQEAIAHQEYPFEKLVNDLNPVRQGSRNPIYDVGFWFHNHPLPRLFGGELHTETSLIDTHTSELDLRVVAAETETGTLRVSFEFQTDLFRLSTVQSLLNSYTTIVRTLVSHPENSLLQFGLQGNLPTSISPWTLSGPPVRLAVAANFIVDPIEPVLSFWAAQWGIEATAEVIPFHLLEQHLLAPPPPIRTDPGWLPVLLISLEHTTPDGSVTTTEALTHVYEWSNRLLEALRQWSIKGDRRPLLLGLCPLSPTLAQRQEESNDLREQRNQIRAEIEKIEGVHLVDLEIAADIYKVPHIHYSYRDELGSLPFTTDFFIAAGTLLARKLYGLLHSQPKVIALDCDNTLWSGVCGEAASDEIALTSPYFILQSFMLEQQRAGRLLCLCSSNNEKDVLEMFKSHPEMPLGIDHFVATRINWERKSVNLSSLAAELNISLEHFIFVDDDPVVCEEIREYCPEVLTVQLPADSDSIPDFLAHVWALDLSRPTEEDRRRTLMYTHNRQRDQLRRESLSLGDFLVRLDVHVYIDQMTADQVSRVAQLTQRTNQFNLTLIRRTQNEVRRLLGDPNYSCWTVRLCDRYGDYGLIGVLIIELRERRLMVDTFLMSCRALGRHVEYRMADKLVEVAEGYNAEDIHIPFVRTARNSPALKFLRDLSGMTLHSNHSRDEVSLRVKAMKANLVFLEASPPVMRQDEYDDAVTLSGRIEDFRYRADRATLLNRITSEVRSIDQIKDAIWSSKGTRPKLSTPYTAPRTRIEERLVKLWSDVLKLERVGVHDNFFECGGHSLLATQLLTRVEANFGVGVTLQAFFDAPSVDGLMRAIAEALVKQHADAETQTFLQNLQQLTETQVQAILDTTASCQSRVRNND